MACISASQRATAPPAVATTPFYRSRSRSLRAAQVRLAANYSQHSFEVCLHFIKTTMPDDAANAARCAIGPLALHTAIPSHTRLALLPSSRYLMYPAYALCTRRLLDGIDFNILPFRLSNFLHILPYIVSRDVWNVNSAGDLAFFRQIWLVLINVFSSALNVVGVIIAISCK